MYNKKGFEVSTVIYTGNYENCKSGRKIVSISGDGGKQVGFTGKRYKLLAPKLSFWKTWHDNIGKIPEKENNIFYIKQYYESVLKNLDISQLLKELNGSIMLCYESNLEFCHRHIVAAYIECESGIIVPEIALDTLGNIIELERPMWIKEEYQKLIYKK